MSTAMTDTTDTPGEAPDFLFGGAADILFDALPGAKLIFDRDLINSNFYDKTTKTYRVDGQ